MEDLETLLKRAKASLAEEDYEKLELLHNAYLTLTGLIEDDKMTIRKLREMLYGRSTEKTSKVVGGVEKGRRADVTSPRRKPSGASRRATAATV